MVQILTIGQSDQISAKKTKIKKQKFVEDQISSIYLLGTKIRK